jgi:hypothetical protein
MHQSRVPRRLIAQLLAAGALSLTGTLQLACSPAPPLEEVLMGVHPRICLGQSNLTGSDKTGLPTVLPNAACELWLNDYHYNDGTHAWGPLRVSPHSDVFSHEVQTSLRLLAAGIISPVIKLSQGATFSNRWRPDFGGESAGTKVYKEIVEAMSKLRDRYPGLTIFPPFLVVDQGEAEARYKDLPTIRGWADNWNLVSSTVQNDVGSDPDIIVVRTCSTIEGKTFPGVLEEVQASICAPEDLINTNDLEYKIDNVHRKGTSQNIVGDRIADRMLVRIAARAGARIEIIAA